LLADRQSVGEAVAEIEPGKMPPLTESAKPFSGGVRQRFVQFNGPDTLRAQEHLHAVDCHITKRRLDDNQ